MKAECCFCSGLLWRLAISSFSTGPIGSFLAGFEFLFSTQSLALTIIRFIPISTIASIHQPIGLYIICTYLFSTRSLFDMARDLASRLAITFLFYGAEQTVSKLSSTLPCFLSLCLSIFLPSVFFWSIFLKMHFTHQWDLLGNQQHPHLLFSEVEMCGSVHFGRRDLNFSFW